MLASFARLTMPLDAESEDTLLATCHNSSKLLSSHLSPLFSQVGGPDPPPVVVLALCGQTHPQVTNDRSRA